jgi:hypothetical protein
MTSVARRGKASGTFSALRQLGGASPAWSRGSRPPALRVHEEFSEGFAAALGACAGLSLLAALAGLALPARPRADEGAVTPVDAGARRGARLLSRGAAPHTA